MNPKVAGFLFFLSGCAALIFESVWFRLTGLFFGNSVAAAATVVAAFMAGLAIGGIVAARIGDQLARPLVFYAWAEIAVAVTGVAVAMMLPAITGGVAPMLEPLLAHPAGLNTARFALAFGVLLVPSVAIGMTLPIFVTALSDLPHRFGGDLGRLYGINTAGAVAGALLFDFLLLEPLGIRGSALFAALLNIVVALGCLAMSGNAAPRREIASGQAAKPPTRPQPLAASQLSPTMLLVAAGLAGGALLALEVVWFRIVLLEVRGTGTVFAILLAIVLVAIAGGGALGGWLLTRRTRNDPSITVFAAGALVIIGYAMMPHDYRLAAAGPDEWRRAFFVSLSLMAPASLMSGLLFTQLAASLRLNGGGAAAAVGKVLAWNTVGAMLGAPLAGFILLPGAGMQVSLWLIAAGYGVIGLMLILTTILTQGIQDYRPLIKTSLAGGVWLAALLMFPWQSMPQRLDAVTAPWRALDGSRTVYQREGALETIQLLRRDLGGEAVAWRLVTDNVSMSNTERDSRRYMQMFAFLPLAMHPAPDDVLLISYGTGATAEALTASPLPKRIDVVDISNETLATSRIIYPSTDNNPLDDSRVRVTIDDGRNVLAIRDKRYDIITGEPPPPRLARIVNLYTKEFFALARSRLSDNGVVSYWLPIDQLNADSSRSILAAFCGVFADCALWAGSNYNWIMTGSRDGLAPIGSAQVERLWRHPETAQQLLETGIEWPAQLLATFIADAPVIREWVGDHPPLTDNFPRRLSDRQPSEATLRQYSSWMDDVSAQQRFSSSQWIERHWPATLRQQAEPLFVFQPIVNNQIRTDWPERLSLADQLLDRGLRIAPAWLLGSSAAEMQVAARKLGATDADVMFHAAVRYLITNNSQAAANLFRRALQAGRPDAAGAAQMADCRIAASGSSPNANPPAGPRVYRCRE